MLKTLTQSFLEKPSKICFEGEDKDEEILYIFRKAIITNVGWATFGIILFFVPLTFNQFLLEAGQRFPQTFSTGTILLVNLFWYVFSIGFVFERFLNWFFTVHIITNKRVVDMDFDHLLHRNIAEAPLRNIEDITYTVTGSLQTIFNYGTVTVQTAAEQRELEFATVARPAKIQDLLSDLVAEVRHDYGS